MTELMRWEPSKRPSALQALQHPFFQVGLSPERPIGQEEGRGPRPDTLNGGENRRDVGNTRLTVDDGKAAHEFKGLTAPTQKPAGDSYSANFRSPLDASPSMLELLLR